MKQLQIRILILALALIPCNFANAWNAFRNETGLHNANITASKTPTDSANTYIKWQHRFSEAAGTAYNSSPVITDTNLYVVCEDVLYELDKNGTVTRYLGLDGRMNSVCQTALHENRIFIPLANGTMQCVDITTMTSLWTSEAFGNQSLTTTLYRNGFVYAGTSHPNGSIGLFYCLNAETGATVWTYTNEEFPCGFYWSGACVFENNMVKGILFGGDNGILVSHSQTSPEVYDTYYVAGKIRAGVTYDEYTNAYYTTSTDGYLYKIQMNEDGTFRAVSSLYLGSAPTDAINCTSTPTICNGRIYVGSFYGTNGRLTVIDAATLTEIYAVSDSACGDIKASPLLSTGYATDENNGKAYVYVTHNKLPGGLYILEDTSSNTNGELKPLIAPTEGQQFCISSVVSDTDGTLYYSNDSGYLFAVAIGKAPIQTASPMQTADTTPPKQPETIVSPTAAPQVVKKTKQPGKPSKVRWTIQRKKNGKYKVTLRWKKGTNTQKTCIQFKGKKKRFCKKTKAIFTLKKGRYTLYLTSYGANSKKSQRVKRIVKIK